MVHLRHTLVHIRLWMNLQRLLFVVIKADRGIFNPVVRGIFPTLIHPLLFDPTITWSKTKGSTFLVKSVFCHTKAGITERSIGISVAL